MINNLNTWVQGIIIAIIVSSIIQMLLPENKNKKYIKAIIGIYILFSILSPVVGKNLDLSEYNLDKYLASSSSSINEENIVYDENIKMTFKSKVVQNIKTQLKVKGYQANNIDIDIDENCNIVYIKLSEIYEYENDEKVEGKIMINKVEDINIKDRPEKGMAVSDANSIIEYLSENYNIDKENIIIE